MTAEPLRALQIFEPDPGMTYTIEAAANITQVPRRLIAVYCKLHMVSPLRTLSKAHSISTTKASGRSGRSTN